MSHIYLNNLQIPPLKPLKDYSEIALPSTLFVSLIPYLLLIYY